MPDIFFIIYLASQHWLAISTYKYVAGGLCLCLLNSAVKQTIVLKIMAINQSIVFKVSRNINTVKQNSNDVRFAILIESSGRKVQKIAGRLR